MSTKQLNMNIFLELEWHLEVSKVPWSQLQDKNVKHTFNFGNLEQQSFYGLQS